MASQAFYQSWQKRFEHNRILRAIVIFFGIYAALLFVALGIILLIIPETRGLAITALIAFVIAKFVVCDLLAFLVNRQRPYQKYNFTPVTFSWLMSIKSKKARSFPSGHMMAMMAVSVVLFSYDIRLGIAGTALAFLTGLARVLMGFHYPSDVIVGFILGIIVGWLTVII